MMRIPTAQMREVEVSENELKPNIFCEVVYQKLKLY